MLKSHIHTTIDYWCIVSLKTGVVKGMLAPLIIGMVPNVPRKSEENLYNCRNQEKMMKMVTPKCWWWFGRSSERVWSEKINF